MIKRADWLAIAKDRTAVVMLLIFAGLAAVIVITTFTRLQPSDIQVPVRFTGFGENNIYRDLWYMQLSWAGFGLLVAAANGFLTVKLYQINRLLGLSFIGLSILVMALAAIIANAIFNLAPL